MLTSTQLDNALALHREVGCRRHGHYDHDAKNSAGPQLTSEWAGDDEDGEKKNAASSTGIEYYIHPVSGELLVK